jgi:phosphoribosylanthranilate isomerase
MNCELIKVCGMRDAENIREVEALGIDLMGFIFWPKSSRYVSERPAYLPTKCKRVGVFVDEDIKQVKRIAEEYALDYIQLHGHESPAYCAQLQGLKLIKAISVSSREDIMTYKSYEGLVDYFLFDTKCPSVGGSGQQFDWTVLADYVGKTPFLLSGGIGPDDAERLRQVFASGGFPARKCAGIDLNSRFELAPGLKDINKLKSFIESL